MPRNLSIAILSGFSGQSAIDEDAGIIRGCKLVELGKLACFAGENGEQKKVVMTDAHISALLGHAGNRSIPIHATHDWFSAQGKDNADSVEMAARIGKLTAFRRNEQGDLIADAHLNKAKSAALDILWGAKNNPEDNCFSAVFNYRKDDPLCMPVNFRAADVVPQGAATTALFHEDKQTDPMTDEEFIAQLSKALASPTVVAALRAACAPEATPDADISAMESAAGVIESDKKPEDANKPALMRAMLSVSRAITRKSTELTAKEGDILVKAKAETTALLGKGGFIKQGEGNNGDEVTAKLAGYIADKSAPNRAAAILVLARREPDIYNRAVASGKL